MKHQVIHWKTFWGGLLLFAVFLMTALTLGMDLPERYPTRFDTSGEPTSWSEGPGSWILLTFLGAFCFGQGCLFQRFLLTDPDSSLLNLPQKKRYLRLSMERKVPIVRRVNRMMGGINILTLLLFFTALLSIYLKAKYPESSAHSVGVVGIWTAVGGVILLPILEIVGIRKMILRAIEIEKV